MIMTARVYLPLLTVAFALCFSLAMGFQAREHLTPQEIDLVKDTQILDKRIDVFIKAVDRRVLVLNGTATSSAKQLKKDSESWGEVPSGTRAPLIGYIARIFYDALTHLDHVSAPDQNNTLIPKAVRNLAAAAYRIVQQLK